MRILFDQGVPRPLRHALSGHEVATTFDMGRANLDNGALLRAAQAAFDVFITTDRNLRFQQNLADRLIAIVVLPTTSWPKLRDHAPQVLNAVNALRPGELVELSL
jgi:hypothetical protein